LEGNLFTSASSAYHEEMNDGKRAKTKNYKNTPKPGNSATDTAAKDNTAKNKRAKKKR